MIPWFHWPLSASCSPTSQESCSQNAALEDKELLKTALTSTTSPTSRVCARMLDSLGLLFANHGSKSERLATVRGFRWFEWNGVSCPATGSQTWNPRGSTVHLELLHTKRLGTWRRGWTAGQVPFLANLPVRSSQKRSSFTMFYILHHFSPGCTLTLQRLLKQRSFVERPFLILWK